MFGGNVSHVEELYELYLSDVSSGPNEWRGYLDASQKMQEVLRELVKRPAKLQYARPATSASMVPIHFTMHAARQKSVIDSAFPE